MTSHRPLGVIAAVGAAALILAGCVAKSDVASGDALVVTSTASGCDVSASSAPCGTVAFYVNFWGVVVSEF